MNRDQRLPLLSQMELLQLEEAENIREHAQTFLPLTNHTLALRPEIVVVRGGRGAGKSALFQLIKEVGSDVTKLFADARIPHAEWIDAFSDTSTAHPTVMALDELANKQPSDSALRAFWLAHLLTQLSRGRQMPLPDGFTELVVAHANEPERWIGWAQANVAAVSSAIDGIERSLESQTVFATYDHLDRLGQHDREVRARYVATLLSLWLSLSNRYRRIRSKIFLRDDLFDAAERAFADASKLRARSVSLEWTVEDLFRAAVRHLAVGADDQADTMRAWLREIPQLELQQHSGFGLLPGPMPEPRQKAFAKALAGELMGSGAKKGFTYRWIPNRLQDAKKRIVPRSMLNLLGLAAVAAKKKPLNSGKRLILPADLAGALSDVSKRRANEVEQEYPIVLRLQNLSNEVVLLQRTLVVERLAIRVPKEPPGLSTNGEVVLDELVDLGVLSIRDNGKIDVPDIFRYGFGIKRKGGVARPR